MKITLSSPGLHQLMLLYPASKYGTAALTGGRTGGHFGRTPARAFGSRRIGQRPGTSASASFGRDPGRWRDPIAHQLKETPDMIGQPAGHRRGTSHPGSFARFRNGSGATQFLMRPTEIVSAPQQIHARVQGAQPMGGMSTLAR